MKSAAAAQDDVELLVAGGSPSLGLLVVALDDVLARGLGDPGVDAERADAEVVAQRPPVGLVGSVEGDERDVVDVRASRIPVACAPA